VAVPRQEIERFHMTTVNHKDGLDWGQSKFMKRGDDGAANGSLCEFIRKPRICKHLMMLCDYTIIESAPCPRRLTGLYRHQRAGGMSIFGGLHGCADGPGAICYQDDSRQSIGDPHKHCIRQDPRCCAVHYHGATRTYPNDHLGTPLERDF
jgi:hypothetical protein